MLNWLGRRHPYSLHTHWVSELTKDAFKGHNQKCGILVRIILIVEMVQHVAFWELFVKLQILFGESYKWLNVWHNGPKLQLLFGESEMVEHVHFLVLSLWNFKFKKVFSGHALDCTDFDFWKWSIQNSNAAKKPLDICSVHFWLWNESGFFVLKIIWKGPGADFGKDESHRQL